MFLWMTPVVVGLVLAIPLAAWTSNPRTGAAFKAAGLLLTPEDRNPPDVLVRANELAAASEYRAPMDAFILLSEDPDVLAAHRAMMPGGKARRRGEFDVDLLVGLAKIDDSDSLEEAADLLTPKEKFAVLSDSHAMERLMAKRRLVNAMSKA